MENRVNPQSDAEDENPAPLTREELEQIILAMRQRRQYRQTLTLKVLARKFGRSITTLRRIEARYNGE